MLHCIIAGMKSSQVKKVNLALQGGGAHGAFTWGVLDRLLEEQRLEIEGISGTSAGAMNAAVLAHGYMNGGRDGAKQELQDFWQRLGAQSHLNPLQPGPLDHFSVLDNPAAYDAFATLGLFLSPYQFNPLALDPLRQIVEERIDFNRLRTESPIKLFVAATQVRTGKIRIFDTDDLSADALLASSCLPSIHHGVEIDGETYWDGAFSGNPAIFPLLHNCKSKDIIVVLLSPLNRESEPYTAEDIRLRSNELSFSAAFLREMRAIADAKQRFSKRWPAFGKMERRLRDMKIHIIQEENLMNELSHASKYNTEMSFLETLRDQGRDKADRWLEKTFNNIGTESTVDLVELFC